MKINSKLIVLLTVLCALVLFTKPAYAYNRSRNWQHDTSGGACSRNCNRRYTLAAFEIIFWSFFWQEKELVEGMIRMASNQGSFRDPSGRVFSKNGKIYRCIFEPGAKDFEAARDAGIYDKLIEAGLLLPHQEVDKHELAPEGTVHCLTHPRLPMISYPWEWSFSMLKEAALIHLGTMEMLIPLGFWLRDASAFNVQFDGNRLRLMDTLSVGQRVPDSPWVGYRQFCSHFLAPLAVAAYCDIRTLSLWRNYIDGYPLDLATKMLPFWRRYRPGLFMHLTLHARVQDLADRRKNIGKPRSKKKPKVSDRGLIGLVRLLRRTIVGIKWKRTSKVWAEYCKSQVLLP